MEIGATSAGTALRPATNGPAGKGVGPDAASGGAVRTANSSVVTLEDCDFVGNTAQFTLPEGEDGYGGAVSNNTSSTIIVSGCRFESNETGILGGGIFALYSALSGGPWEGVWWGVQEAGMNWSGDNIRNLETITFTRNDDKTITVDHRVQQGSKEVEGSLSGTGAIDGGRLLVTTKTGREVTFSYSRISKLIELPLKNADKTPVTVKPLTEENNNDMEEIRSEIVKISQKPENKIDTTLSSTKS